MKKIMGLIGTFVVITMFSVLVFGALPSTPNGDDVNNNNGVSSSRTNIQAVATNQPGFSSNTLIDHSDPTCRCNTLSATDLGRDNAPRLEVTNLNPGTSSDTPASN